MAQRLRPTDLTELQSNGYRAALVCEPDETLLLVWQPLQEAGQFVKEPQVWRDGKLTPSGLPMIHKGRLSACDPNIYNSLKAIEERHRDLDLETERLQRLLQPFSPQTEAPTYRVQIQQGLRVAYKDVRTLTEGIHFAGSLLPQLRGQKAMLEVQMRNGDGPWETVRRFID